VIRRRTRIERREVDEGLVSDTAVHHGSC